MSAWAAAGQAASGIAGGLIANAGNARRQRKGYHQQKKLMDIQQKNQMELNRQGADLQYEQWQKTNYPAQMEMIKEAGLNPGLLYGMGGAGGATAGNQGGGSAASGNAPNPKDVIPMDIGNSIALATEIDLRKAQARDINAAAEQKEIDNEYEKRIKTREEQARYGRSKAEMDHQNITATKFDPDKPDESGLSEYQKGQLADYEKKQIDRDKAKIETNLQELVRQGKVSENEVLHYKAELAKAKIDPDSNPLVREMMKAMAAEGYPLTEIMQRILRFFVK